MLRKFWHGVKAAVNPVWRWYSIGSRKERKPTRWGKCRLPKVCWTGGNPWCEAKRRSLADIFWCGAQTVWISTDTSEAPEIAKDDPCRLRL